jgi:hypothetical protein
MKLPLLILAAETNLTETLLGFLPIALFLLVLFFLFRRQQKSPTVKLQRQYLESQIEHMPKIEALLERIAKALERDQKT